MLRTIDLRGRALSPAELLAAVPRATAARARRLSPRPRELVADVAAHGEARAARAGGAIRRRDRITPSACPPRTSTRRSPRSTRGARGARGGDRAGARGLGGPGAAASRHRARPRALACRQRWQPVRRVGVYVPGGKAVYPSSVVMNVVPAQVAGVSRSRSRRRRSARTAGGCTRRSSPPRGCSGSTRSTPWAVPARSARFAYGVATLGLDPVDVVTGPGQQLRRRGQARGRRRRRNGCRGGRRPRSWSSPTTPPTRASSPPT